MVPPAYPLAIRRLEMMPWIPALLLCLGLACCGPSQAQVFDATSLREPADLAATWLVHAGDDPAYARPGFDDSNWTPFNAGTDDLRNVFPKGRPDFVWYRLHVKVDPNNKGLALLEMDAPAAFELYSNGAMLLKAGEVKPYVRYDTSARTLVPVPDSQLSNGTILIALRVRIDDRLWPFPQPGLQAANFKIGQQEVLRTYKWYSLIGNRALEWLDDLVNLCLMLGALLLFSTQRNRREYLWLFLWVFVGIPSWVLSITATFHNYRYTWHILDIVGNVLWPYLVARMYCAFVGHRIGWKLNLYLGLCSLCAVLLSIPGFIFGFGMSLRQIEIMLAPQTLLLVAVLPLIMLRHIHRENRAEGLLIVPMLIFGLANFTFYFVSPALTAIFLKRDWSWLSNTMIGPFVVYYSQVADILSMLCLALIILIRSNRASRQQSQLEAEIANAREVQQVILPEPVQSIPGFRIESIYEPAREVGGDFYQILPAGKDGLLLVIGDVAGKGLPAAMLVSLLVGTIRTAAEETHAPAAILAKMNQRLLGRANGGFSTALAALFAADGTVTIANAGHLSPYLDGFEVELPAALPLGVIDDPGYETSQTSFEAGSRFTFYTDGVIEAQDKQRNLFGFERGKAISTQSAEQIVKAAQQFGQTDDITVVAIQREATVAAATSGELIHRQVIIAEPA